MVRTSTICLWAIAMPSSVAAVHFQQEQAPEELAKAVDDFQKHGGSEDKSKAYWLHNMKKVRNKAEANRQESLELREDMETRMANLVKRVQRLEAQRNAELDKKKREEMKQSIDVLLEQKRRLGRQRVELNNRIRNAEEVTNVGHHEDLRREEENARKLNVQARKERDDSKATERVWQEIKKTKEKEKENAEQAERNAAEMASRAAAEEELRKKLEEKRGEEEREARRTRAAHYQAHLKKDLEEEEHRRKLAEKQVRELDEQFKAVERERRLAAAAASIEAQALQVAADADQQADDAANASAPVEDDARMNTVLFKDMIGDVSTSVWGEMVRELQDVVQDGSFMDNFTATSTVMRSQSRDYVDTVNEQVTRFVSDANESTRQEFVPLLAKFLAQTEQLFIAHQRHTVGAAKVMKESLPLSLRRHLLTIVVKMMPKMLPFTRNTTYFTRMAQTPPAEVCGQIASVMEGVGNMSKLEQTKEMLNAAVVALPSLSMMVPGASTTSNVSGFVQELIKLGHGEVVTLEQASHTITSALSPIISSKLGCTWSPAAGVRPGILVLFMVVIARFL